MHHARPNNSAYQFSLTSFNNAVLAIMILVLASCGSGGGGGSNAASGTSYSYVMPQVNSQRNYTNIIIDNSNNTINQTFSHTVTAVNPDESFVVLQDDPNHNSVTVNGTNYSVPTENINFNNSGQKTSYSFTPVGGSLTTCTDTPHGIGPDYPLKVGQTWSSSFTRTCGTAAPPISYTQTGTVVDVESVTVPAGTFNALKLQSTVKWTNANGTTRTETITNWRDVNTGHSVQEINMISISGTIPINGYEVKNTQVLQSQS